ncbi:hypothetical protein [Lacrimispora sp.]|uniref:hypothetical protein n=1 Tax=Lacrimispora sp. TaxID=2719234 RepID=UPI00285701D3|nr:hypothetical protein [Lacrimispora sp.]MDR7813888.1 hypothetical protein [Lacrimispora sp.]
MIRYGIYKKKGNGYEIRVCNGYDSNEKKIEINRTFIPKDTWNEDRIEKKKQHIMTIKKE